jgi:hypothetical protein
MIDGDEAIRKLALDTARFTGLIPWPGRSSGGVGAIAMLRQVPVSAEKHPGVNRCLTPCTRNQPSAKGGQRFMNDLSFKTCRTRRAAVQSGATIS